MSPDPFAEFDTAPEIAHETISARSLQVPDEDRGLFEQLRNDPRLTNIRDEIAYNRYLRILLSKQLAASGDEDERLDLIDKIRDIAKKYGMDEEDLQEFRRAVDKVVPPAQISLQMVRALSNLLQTSGKLAEQQKKIIDGTEINVNISGENIIRKIFTHIIRPEVPMEYWDGIRQRAREFAPLLGSTQVIDLDDVLQ